VGRKKEVQNLISALVRGFPMMGGGKKKTIIKGNPVIGSGRLGGLGTTITGETCEENESSVTVTDGCQNLFLKRRTMERGGQTILHRQGTCTLKITIPMHKRGRWRRESEHVGLVHEKLTKKEWELLSTNRSDYWSLG